MAEQQQQPIKAPPASAFVATDKIDDAVVGNLVEGVPILFRGEVVLGSELGSGGFCRVFAARSLKPLSATAAAHPPPSDEEQQLLPGLTDKQRDDRRRLELKFKNYEKHHFSYRHTPGQPPPMADPSVQKPPRIALKTLRFSLPEKKFETGQKDLMMEVKILSLVGKAHPNIITLHAVGYEKDASDALSSQRATFVVLDQLRSTLKNKLYMWREARGLGVLISRQALNELWLVRMVVLAKVADAIRFLHSRNIVHGDINPDNIGFDSDDVVKLFDLGLARTLGDNGNTVQEATTNNDGDGDVDQGDNALYEMTAKTGTMRYMAPEVAWGHKYGAKVDVYSLSIVIWSVLSLLKPYVNISPSAFGERVIRDGLRSPIDNSWPSGIKSLMTRMWDPDSTKRPSSAEVVATLEDLLRGLDEDLFPTPALKRLFAG